MKKTIQDWEEKMKNENLEKIHYTKCAWKRDGFSRCISCGKTCSKGVTVRHKPLKVVMPFCFKCYNQQPDELLEMVANVTYTRYNGHIIYK